MARMRSEADYQGIKTAFRVLTNACGGVDGSDGYTRVHRSVLNDYGNINRQIFPPADVIADLEFATGLPVVTRFLARLTGGVLVPVAPLVGQAIFTVRLCDIGKRMASLFTDAAAALADGKITAQEREQLIGDCDEAMSALAAARGLLAQMREDA